MAYITVSNAKKIIRRLDENTLESSQEKIYKHNIYFFSKREGAKIKGIWELFKDLENFAIEYYKPIEVVDTLRYLTPENQPAYDKHTLSDFIFFKVNSLGKYFFKYAIMRFCTKKVVIYIKI